MRAERAPVGRCYAMELNEVRAEHPGIECLFMVFSSYDAAGIDSLIHSLRDRFGKRRLTNGRSRRLRCISRLAGSDCSHRFSLTRDGIESQKNDH